jgi:hypothetical protein
MTRTAHFFEKNEKSVGLFDVAALQLPSSPFDKLRVRTTDDLARTKSSP